MQGKPIPVNFYVIFSSFDRLEFYKFIEKFVPVNKRMLRFEIVRWVTDQLK
jgi:hypothetical protein